MWLIYLVSPTLNVGYKKGATLLASGLVRTEEMLVDRCDTREQAKSKCIELALRTLKENGYDTTVIGFGFRNRRAKRHAPLDFLATIQQVHTVLVSKGYTRKDLDRMTA